MPELEGQTRSDPVWHRVKKSSLHGRGVFARRKIPAGTRIFEYEGKRITNEEADALESADPDNPYHTFFFMISAGMIIDGNQGGNDARWINHSCVPNCETEEDENGERVFVLAMRDIERGEELTFDYGLVIDEPLTVELKAQYACLCGAPNCRGTMLALPPAKKTPAEPIWHRVKKSSLHGQGVFARKKIPAGTQILEYEGKRITNEEADELESADPDNPYHTFFFMISAGMIIDGNQDGNDARWINHSCEPNCETEEDENGERVFVLAMRDIERGEELTFDYGLVIEGRKTAKLKAQYACFCGAPSCRGTMLALTRRSKKTS